MSYMAGERGGDTVIKIVVGVIVAVVVLFGAAYWFANRTQSPEDLQADIDGAIQDDKVNGPLLLELKATYPADYQTYTKLLIDLHQRGASEMEVRSASQALSRQLAMSHGADFRVAPTAALFKVRDGNLGVIRALKAESSDMCAHFAMTGLSPTDRPSRRTMLRMTQVGVDQVRAMAAGRAKPFKRGKPTQSDVMALRKEMLAQGSTAAEFDAMVQGTAMGMPLDRQCMLGVALYQSLVNMEEGPSDRLSAMLLLPEQ